MKLNYKFFSLKRIYIHFCLLALLNIFFSTTITNAQIFSINDVEISTPFEINFDKNQIVDQGFKEAFDRLVLSIVQTQDQEKLNQISLSIIKGMIEKFSIKEEKFIDEIYHLNLNVSFNKKKVLSLLEKKNIFPSLLIRQNIFFIPIIFDENKNEMSIFSENFLFDKWNKNKKLYHLLNYVLPIGDLEDLNLIKSKSSNLENYDFKEIIKKYNLEDYVVMIVYKNNNDVRVFSKIFFRGTMSLKNYRFQSLKIENNNQHMKFIKMIKNDLEDHWKSKNQMNTSIKLPILVSIKNDDNSKIFSFENTIKNLDFLHDFNIFKFDNKKNVYKIIFNGSPDNFLDMMKKNDYEFDTQNRIWGVK